MRGRALVRVVLLALAVMVVAAAPAAAGELSLGVATGGHLFADDLELGVADAAEQGAPASGVLVGARLGVRILPRVSLEGEVVLIPTTERMTGKAIEVVGFRGQAAVDLLRRGRLRPFLVAGVGGLDVAARNVPTMEDDSDLALHWGGGLGVALSPSFELRFDGRHLLLPNIADSGGSSDFEVSVGMSYVFGRDDTASRPAAAPAPLSAPVSPPPSDVDRDGLVDPVDDCPSQPETLNSYQDDDGCPDFSPSPAPRP